MANNAKTQSPYWIVSSYTSFSDANDAKTPSRDEADERTDKQMVTRRWLWKYETHIGQREHQQSAYYHHFSFHSDTSLSQQAVAPSAKWVQLLQSTPTEAC